MKHILFLLMVLFTSISFAQRDVVATGGDGVSSEGAVSFSVGQIAFSSATDALGNSNQGVQQPIEIFELSNVDFGAQFINASLFPNPAATSVTLYISSVTSDANFEYDLADVTGKIIRTGKISTEKTIIDVVGFPQACYFVNVKTSNKIVKTFKLLKNE